MHLVFAIHHWSSKSHGTVSARWLDDCDVYIVWHTYTLLHSNTCTHTRSKVFLQIGAPFRHSWGQTRMFTNSIWQSIVNTIVSNSLVYLHKDSVCEGGRVGKKYLLSSGFIVQFSFWSVIVWKPSEIWYTFIFKWK